MTADQILTVDQMRAAEQSLIDAGSSVDALMQVAGRGAADWVWRMAGKGRVTVLCGPGNNGGDGYVIAEAIRERGGEAVVVAASEPKTDAARNARAAFGGEVLGPDANELGTLTEPREFNLMFKTYVGALSGEEGAAFLRPETAQGIFVNFKNVVDSSRVKIPFGIAQVGKSFRNEITPRNFTFRSREFEQMEIEFFCHPDSSQQWYRFWRDRRLQWYKDLGLSGERLILREHHTDELSHYSTGTADIEYAFPFLPEGEFGELEGIAHRGDFDLRRKRRVRPIQ